MKRRKRLPDGSLGELEEVFSRSNETPTNEQLQEQILGLQEYIVNKELEDLIKEGGVI